MTTHNNFLPYYIRMSRPRVASLQCISLWLSWQHKGNTLLYGLKSIQQCDESRFTCSFIHSYPTSMSRLYTRVSPSTYHVTELVHRKGEGDQAVLILLVVAVDELLVLFVHGLAVGVLLAAAVLLPIACLWGGRGEVMPGSTDCGCIRLYLTQIQRRFVSMHSIPLTKLYLELLPLVEGRGGDRSGHNAGEHEDFHLQTQNIGILPSFRINRQVYKRSFIYNKYIETSNGKIMLCDPRISPKTDAGNFMSKPSPPLEERLSVVSSR